MEYNRVKCNLHIQKKLCTVDEKGPQANLTHSGEAAVWWPGLDWPCKLKTPKMTTQAVLKFFKKRNKNFK